jgi:hypothetical protein
LLGRLLPGHLGQLEGDGQFPGTFFRIVARLPGVGLLLLGIVAFGAQLIGKPLPASQHH